MEKDSETYRELKSDKKAHNINIDSEKIKIEVKEELASRGGWKFKTIAQNEDAKPLPKSLENIVDTEVPKMCKALYKDFNGWTTRRETSIIRMRGTETNFKFTMVPKKEGTNVFGVFRTSKQNAQKPLVSKLRKQIDKLNKAKSRQKPENKIEQIGDVFTDIGHRKGSAVSEQRKRAADKALFEFTANIGDRSLAEELLAELRDITNFRLTHASTTFKDTASIEIESSFLNKQRGGDTEKKLAEQLVKDLETILEKYAGQTWVDQKGSLSRREKIEALITNEVIGLAGKNPNVKANFKTKKIKRKSTTKTKSRGKVTKATLGRAWKDTSVEKLNGVGSAANVSGPSMFSIMAMIDKKLPQTVRKNMGFPRLENRSGRFASSAKMVNVTQTPKGYPSFGYTYDRDPYQVFEPGSSGNWASQQRDPRKIIDLSIREIASELALGRFYTRRV